MTDAPATATAPPPTVLLFVRHAEVYNPQRVIYGRLPRFGLSPRGYEEAERTARFLASEAVVAIYSSPLLRARQTAAVLQKQFPHAPVRYSWLLAEVRTGYQGLKDEGLPPTFSFYEPLKNPDDETVPMVFARMDRALRRLRARHQGETIICVSHGDPIKILTKGYQGWPLTVATARQPDPARGSVTRFLFHPGNPHPQITYTDPGNPSQGLLDQYTRVGRADELPEHGLLRVVVDGHDLLVARVDGEVHALENRCGCAAGPLHQGERDGPYITCPRHGTRFDLRSGVAVAPPLALPNHPTNGGEEPPAPPTVPPQRHYPAREHNGELYVKLAP